jgi:CrcB protein
VSFPTWLAFLAAAAIGAPARYLLDGAIGQLTEGTFPWGTCAVNVSGSFLLGVVTGLGLYHGLSSDVRVVAGTGFCGAYTTFSTFTYEAFQLLESGTRQPAVRYVALNVLGGLAAAAVGLVLAAA